MREAWVFLIRIALGSAVCVLILRTSFRANRTSLIYVFLLKHSQQNHQAGLFRTAIVSVRNPSLTFIMFVADGPR